MTGNDGFEVLTVDDEIETAVDKSTPAEEFEQLTVDNDQNPLLGNVKPGDYSALDALKQQAQNDGNAAPTAPAGGTPDPNAAPAGGGDAPDPNAAAEEEVFDQPDTTNWADQATAELEQQMKFLGVKSEQIKTRADFEFVQDQYDFINSEIDKDPEIAQLHANLQMGDLDVLFEDLNKTYGRHEDEEEILKRMEAFTTEDGKALNDKGKRVVERSRQEWNLALGEKGKELRLKGAEYAKGQRTFYNRIHEQSRDFQPPAMTFRVGQEEITMDPIKVPIGQRRALSTFVSGDYVNYTRGNAGEGSDRVKVITDSAFWVNPALRDPYLSDLLAAAYQRGQSDYIAKNIK